MGTDKLNVIIHFASEYKTTLAIDGEIDINESDCGYLLRTKTKEYFIPFSAVYYVERIL